jgi:uncharacterized membrane protein
MMLEDAETQKLRKRCFVLYGLYALSAALQVSDDLTTLGLSLLTLAIAGHLGNAKKEAAKDTPYASHLRWLYRTAWIASCVAIPVNLGLSTALIWAFTDVGAIAHSVMNGDPDALTQDLQGYIAGNMTKISIFNMIGAAPPTIWWLHRCWRGYVLLKEGKPVENVTSWL